MADGGSTGGRRVPIDTLLNKDYDPHVHASAQSDEASIQFVGYQLVIWKSLIYKLLVLLTLGALWLLARWFPSIYITMNCKPCDLRQANRVCAKVRSEEIPFYLLQNFNSLTSFLVFLFSRDARIMKKKSLKCERKPVPTSCKKVQRNTLCGATKCGDGIKKSLIFLIALGIAL